MAGWDDLKIDDDTSKSPSTAIPSTPQGGTWEELNIDVPGLTPQTPSVAPPSVAAPVGKKGAPISTSASASPQSSLSALQRAYPRSFGIRPDPTPFQREWGQLPFFTRMSTYGSRIGRSMPIVGQAVPESEHLPLLRRAYPGRDAIADYTGHMLPYILAALAGPQSLGTLRGSALFGAGLEGGDDALRTGLAGGDISEITASGLTGAARGALSTLPSALTSRVLFGSLPSRSTRITRDIEGNLEIARTFNELYSAYTRAHGKPMPRSLRDSLWNDIVENVQSRLTSHTPMGRLSESARTRAFLNALGAPAVQEFGVGDDTSGAIADTLAGTLRGQFPVNP